ncbi:MAG TPA: prephenate dehydrogenase/arogenate dehydrogenase family protein [Candidatus Baltobacteraceae bacterium]|nr:prephenate dehydrogenase/arogenate dehydrogenase family protein [Candidatus Baltobacteraceae bacterium]
MNVEIAGIIGTGLIGSSIGLRARAQGYRVFGHDIQDVHARQAAERGAIDTITTIEHIQMQCGVIVVALPVRAACEYLASIDRTAPPHARLIIDVASVKGPIVLAAQGLPNFVGSHPMAGNEGTGPAAADGGLFETKPWLYVPPQDADVERRAIEFITALGGNPFATDAAEHDAMLALTSHMPQLLAYAFAEEVSAAGAPERVLPYCGPAARELLRLGRSPLPMWQDIFGGNAIDLARVLRTFAARLQHKADLFTL